MSCSSDLLEQREFLSDFAELTKNSDHSSNQVREGLLARDEALELAKENNQPKIESLEYFAYLIGFNLDDVLVQVNTIPKMY